MNFTNFKVTSHDLVVIKHVGPNLKLVLEVPKINGKSKECYTLISVSDKFRA